MKFEIFFSHHSPTLVENQNSTRMKLIIFILLAFAIAVGALNQTVKPQGVDRFDPGKTYVFDSSIWKWKLVDDNDLYKAISLHYVIGIDQVLAQYAQLKY